MMGSRRKVALVKRHFIEEMLIDEEGWKKIHAPIGLDIGAETVPEIAASIVAELVAVRRKREVS
jgi:xanthine dehydrogenase accessory factor